MEPPEQAIAILALSHRKPLTYICIGADKYKDRIKLDAKLADIRDKKNLTDDIME